MPSTRALGDRVVHAVEAAQKGGLAAARRPDHGEHLIAADVEIDVLDGVFVAVVNIHAARRHHGIAHAVAHGCDGVVVGNGEFRRVNSFIALAESSGDVIVGSCDLSAR